MANALELVDRTKNKKERDGQKHNTTSAFMIPNALANANSLGAKETEKRTRITKETTLLKKKKAHTHTRIIICAFKFKTIRRLFGGGSKRAMPFNIAYLQLYRATATVRLYRMDFMAPC